MTVSPKLSRWFYEYTAQNHRLPDSDWPATRRQPPGPKPGRRRGGAPGEAPKRLTAAQRQQLIDLLRKTPRGPSIVAKQFTEATGITVSQVTIFTVRKKAIKAGTLQLA